MLFVICQWNRTRIKIYFGLDKCANEYKGNARAGVLAKLLDKDQDEVVYWYETNCKDTNGYSIMSKPENINIQKYKSIRLDKLADTLEIAGFNISDLRLELLQKTLSIIRKYIFKELVNHIFWKKIDCLFDPTANLYSL